MALTMRIEAKKAELENLGQLRDLSSALASQMQALEAKLCTLKDGTEGMSANLNLLLSLPRGGNPSLTYLPKLLLVFWQIGRAYCRQSTWQPVSSCVPYGVPYLSSCLLLHSDWHT